MTLTAEDYPFPGVTWADWNAEVRRRATEGLSNSSEQMRAWAATHPSDNVN